MQYKQFYFLHLDKVTAKTAGIRLFDPLYKVIEDHGISAVELNKSHSSHNYWQDFDEDTFIFCVVRDPILRALSEFSWWANYGDDGKRTHSAGRDRECPFYTEENLFKWIETKHLGDYQHRIIGNRLPRINMAVRAEGIQHNENKLREKILKELGISHQFSYYPPDFEEAFMPMEKAIYEIINNNSNVVSLLREKNKKDIELHSKVPPI